MIMSWLRKPRNERHRRSGTDRLDQRHWNVKTIVKHTSRIELSFMLASPAEVAETRMRWETSLRKACRWSELTKGSCGIDQRRTLVTLWKQKTKSVIRLTVSGRAGQSLWRTLPGWVDFYNGKAAMVGHVSLAILATMADGAYELIPEQKSKSLGKK